MSENKPSFIRNNVNNTDAKTPPYTDNQMNTYPPKGGSSAYMREDIMDLHTHGFAITANWEQSYLCPCRNRETRQPDPNCDECFGRGVAFQKPEELVLMIQSQERGIINADLGLMDSGTAIGTPERGNIVAFRDRLEVPDAKIPQSLIFDVTPRRVEKGFYLLYNVKDLKFAVIKGRTLKLGEDYYFDVEKNRIYPKEHLLGENVSVNIMTTLRYFVADLLKEHRYAHIQNGDIIKSPQKLLLKREDIFIDRDHFETDKATEELEPKRKSSDTLHGFF